MSDSEFWVFLVLFFIAMFVIGLANLELWQDRAEQYDLYMPKGGTHKPRMKYLTELSCEQTLLQLTQMCAPFDCTFEKEKDEPKDQMYVFSIAEVPLRYYGMFRGSITYKVLVTPTQEGCAVWLFLFAYTKTPWIGRNFGSMTKFTEDEMLDMFAWEVEKLFGKLLGAVRVE